jgi:hypothetical protein
VIREATRCHTASSKVGLLPDPIAIIAVSRTETSSEDYVAELTRTVKGYLTQSLHLGEGRPVGEVAVDVGDPRGDALPHRLVEGAARLLMPALYNLALWGLLPDPIAIIAVSRTETSSEDYVPGCRGPGAAGSRSGAGRASADPGR